MECCLVAEGDLQRVFSVLIRFDTALRNAVDTRLRADCDLPLSRFAPIQVIARYANCRVHDIADELPMTVGGASKIADRIEASGYCARSPARVTGDHRSSISRPRGTDCWPGPLEYSTTSSEISWAQR